MSGVKQWGLLASLLQIPLCPHYSRYTHQDCTHFWVQDRKQLRRTARECQSRESQKVTATSSLIRLLLRKLFKICWNVPWLFLGNFWPILKAYYIKEHFPSLPTASATTIHVRMTLYHLCGYSPPGIHTWYRPRSQGMAGLVSTHM